MENERALLDELPNAALYERSYMHRDQLLQVVATRSGPGFCLSRTSQPGAWLTRARSRVHAFRPPLPFSLLRRAGWPGPTL